MDGLPRGRPRAAAGRGAVRATGGARLAVAACLLVLVAAGLRGAVGSPALDGPLRHDGLLTAAIAEGVLACLLVVLAVRHAAAPRDAVLAARLRRLLTYVVVIALVAIPLGYLPLNKLKLKPSAPRRTQPAQPHAVLPHPAAGGPPLAVVIVLIVLAGLAAAALIYLIARFARLPRGRRRRWRGQAVELAPALAEDDEAGLRDAVESGQRALRRVDDTRAAVIACYAAMEQSLARAGAVRAVADTPGELLARAAGQGLVGSGSAARLLTALFYEARFSSHPMQRALRDEAERALDELAASLGASAPAAVSTTTGTGAGQ